MTGLRYKFEYPTLEDRRIEWKNGGWTPKYTVMLRQEGHGEGSDTKYVKERDFRLSVGQDWRSESFWYLNIDSVWYRKKALAEIPTCSFC